MGTNSRGQAAVGLASQQADGIQKLNCATPFGMELLTNRQVIVFFLQADVLFTFETKNQTKRKNQTCSIEFRLIERALGKCQNLIRETEDGQVTSHDNIIVPFLFDWRLQFYNLAAGNSVLS